MVEAPPEAGRTRARVADGDAVVDGRRAAPQARTSSLVRHAIRVGGPAAPRRGRCARTPAVLDGPRARQAAFIQKLDRVSADSGRIKVDDSCLTDGQGRA
ncbi:MAG: hypothetical protein WCK01_00485 [Candidatus Uhrbacteria bacterium]